MTTFKLYGSAAATANGVAQVILPAAGRIKGVQWAVNADMVADNSALALELSRASASEIGVNGAQQCISEIRAYGNLVTSGFPMSMLNYFFPLDIPIFQGQIIYLHCSITTCTFYATALIHVL